MKIEYLGGSALTDVSPYRQTTDDGNPGIGIFSDGLKNVDNVGGDIFEFT